MKVLHIFNELKFSGAEIMYADAAEEFQKLGCELYAINAGSNLGEYSSTFKKVGFTVFHLPYPRNYFAKLKYYLKIVKLVREFGINVIHTHNSSMKWGMAFSAKLAGVKSIYTAHNCFYNPIYTKPYQIWLRWSARVLLGCKFQSISDSVEANELKFYHNKTIKVHNWYGYKRFYPAIGNEKSQIRKKLGITDSALVIVSVGGCSPIKRHSDIIKILPELLKENPDTIYLHLGEGNSTKEEQELAKKLQISNHIKFLGNQSNVRNYLIASDFYIMPSKFEGISITTIEALACKIPAILYDVPGLRDFNSEMTCAQIIPENPMEVVNSIRELIANPNRRHSLTENGYNYVTSKYYLPTNVRQIFSLYH